MILRTRALSLLVTAVVAAACTRVEPPRDGLRSLVEAVQIPQGAGPRFSAGFSLPFGSGSLIAGDNVEALTAAAQIARAVARRTPGAVHEYALVQVLLGRHEDAMASLERLAAAEPSWSVWNDLAGVYLLTGHARLEASHEQWVRALDAALRATELAPDNADTWYNRALAIERAGLLSSEDAWAVYHSFAGDPETPHRPDETAALWAAIKLRLESLDATLDPAGVRQWLPRFAQPLREYISDRLLPQWGDTVDPRQAGALLDRASLIAAALADATGDTLLKDAVESLRRASGIRRTAMARAFVAFGRGRARYAVHDYREAEVAFTSAAQLFGSSGHPFHLWSRTHHALCLYYLRQADRMSAELAVVLRTAPDGYRTVRARAEWAAAPPAFARGESDAALRHLARSLELFQQTHEAENAASVAFVSAEALRQVGDDRAAWAALSRALPWFGQIQQPLMRYQLLFATSLMAGHYELSYASLYLQDCALREGRRDSTTVAAVEGLTRRAERRLLVGDRVGASKDLVRAATELGGVPSPELAAALQDAIDTVGADLLADDRPEQARALLERAASHRRTTNPAELPRLLLRLGRLSERGGDVSAARRQIEQGIDAFEQRRRGVAQAAQRISFLDEGWDLYAERLSLELSAGMPSPDLFHLADEAKGRVLRELLPAGTTSPSIDEIQRRLSADQAVVSYAILPARSVAWVITSSGYRFVPLAVAPADLVRLVADYRSLLTLDRDDPALVRLSRELFDLVLGPLQAAIGGRTRLAVIPDGTLHALPFATLMRPSGRFLVEDTEVVIAPNASVLVHSAERLRQAVGPPRSALVIGDPDFDKERFPTLARLTDARAEALTIRRQYPAGELALSRDATPSFFHAAAGRYDVVHFAGHALENTRYPWRSALVLAGSPEDSGLVYAQDIARWDLSRVRVVTLAACETGTGRLYRGEGVVSLATPFLAAGVPIVVAALWKVDDRAARAIFERFHQELAAGASPSSALHIAQRSQVTSDTGHRSPRDWGAYLVVGGTRLGS